MPDNAPINVMLRNHAAGMNAASRPPSLARQDEATLIVNGTVRNGFVTTRPGWHCLPLNFIDSPTQLEFQSGVFQGWGFFNSAFGKFFVLSIDGSIYIIDTVKMYAVKLVTGAFSKFSTKVMFQQRGRWMIAQDGESPPLVMDGYKISQGVTATGVPTGFFMADGWHRLVVVSYDRRRIYLSDHELDPTSTPISFTDGAEYFANSRYFENPPSLGRIMGVSFSPYQDTSTGIGPLVVFSEHGVRTYNIGVPRSQWTANDISQTILPKMGSSTFMAYTDRGSDLMFRDHDGRIRSLRNAQQVLASGLNIPNDYPVWDIIKTEDASLREHSSAATFDARSFFTTHPVRRRSQDGRYNVIHNGLAVLEHTHLAPEREDVWTFWTGLDIVSLCTGVIEGQSTMLAFCADADGVNRVYSLTRDAKEDVVSVQNKLEPRQIQMLLTTRTLDFDIPDASKALNYSGMRLAGMNGRVDVSANWVVEDRPVTWLNHAELHPECLTIDKCNLFEPQASQNNLVLSSPPDGRDNFYKCRAAFKITGHARVEEMVFNASLVGTTPSTNVRCNPLPAGPPASSCGFPLFGYKTTN